MTILSSFLRDPIKRIAELPMHQDAPIGMHVEAVEVLVRGVEAVEIDGSTV